MGGVEADPGVGEPLGIRALAAARSSKASQLRATRVEVTAAVDTVVRSAWRGKAQSAFVSTVGAVTPDLLLLADGLDAQAAALHSYAGQVQQIKDQQAALALQRSHAHTAMDTALSKLHASHNLDDRVLAQERATGQQMRTDDILRLRARLTERIEAERSVLRRVDAQWAELVTWRRRVDAVCSAALAARPVLGKTWQLSTGAIRTSLPAALLAMLDGLSVTDLHALLKAHPELASKLARTDPQLVAGWWHGLDGAEGGLSEAQTVLVTGIPTIIGALSGLPALVRIEANRINAATQLARSRKKVARLQEVESIVEALAGHPDKASHDEIRRLTSEIGYLRAVVTGTIQLYLYDPGASRIIEMIGTPSPKTTHVITYVPGTFTNLNAFYANGVQQVGKYLTVGRDDTLAFIYKDGPVPRRRRQTRGCQSLAHLGGERPKGSTQCGKDARRLSGGTRARPTAVPVRDSRDRAQLGTRERDSIRNVGRALRQGCLPLGCVDAERVGGSSGDCIFGLLVRRRPPDRATHRRRRRRKLSSRRSRI